VTDGGQVIKRVRSARLGVPASAVGVTLRGVFPHIAKPTKTQAQLMPAIMSGKYVLLKDHAETGKDEEFHTPVTAYHTFDQSTESQVIWFNLGLVASEYEGAGTNPTKNLRTLLSPRWS
jgi:hypothetical protein